MKDTPYAITIGIQTWKADDTEIEVTTAAATAMAIGEPQAPGDPNPITIRISNPAPFRNTTTWHLDHSQARKLLDALSAVLTIEG